MTVHDEHVGWVNNPSHPQFWRAGTDPAVGCRVDGRQHGTGEILALGDSFTFGSEVEDTDTWPYVLSFLLGRPVANAGVGGHGLDQTYLLGGRLVSALAPRVVLISVIPPSVDRCGSDMFSGASKPYYHDGQWHNVPVPHRSGFAYLQGLATRLGLHELAWRDVMSRAESLEVAEWLVARIASTWIAPRVVLVAQCGVGDFTPAGAEGRARQLAVIETARTCGLEVVDTHHTLRSAVAALGAERMYVGGTGHMTKRGNELVARMVWAHLVTRG